MSLIKKELNLDYIGKKNIFFTISIVVIVISTIFAMVFGVPMDIQFKGGTIITYNYSGDINKNELADFVESTINKKVSIDEKRGISGSDSFDIVLTDADGLDSNALNKLTDELQAKYGEKISFLENASVDAIIGKEFFIKSLAAVAVASLLLIIYIAFRFKKIGGFSAGVTGVIALLHDVAIVFATFVLFRIPLDANFIAVVLTILGYSINDTIIIYDRIRENKRLYGRELTIDALVNKSINQTMARTINTTISTLIALVSINVVALATGVTSIISFVFPLIIGMLSGTYSSVFIAGPLWVMWQNKKSAVVAHKNKSHKK